MNERFTRVSALAAASLLALSLSACGSGQDTVPETTAVQTSAAEETAPVQSVPETEQAEATQAIYRAEFAQQLAALRAKYGTSTGESEDRDGVMFADLLDWDADGTPELLTITRDHAVDVMGMDTFRFAVWGAADAALNVAAVPLLETVIGSSYGDLGPDASVYISRGSDGALMLCVDDGHELEDLKETYYSFSGGKVSSTVLTAQSSVGGWDENDNPADLDTFQIDGSACDKATFDARRSALGRDDCMAVFGMHHHDISALDAFLTEQSDVYSGGALLESAHYADSVPTQWLEDVLFTVGA